MKSDTQYARITKLIAKVEAALDETLRNIGSLTEKTAIAPLVDKCATRIYDDMRKLTDLAITYGFQVEDDDYRPYDASGIGQKFRDIIAIRFRDDWATINSCNTLIDHFMGEFDGDCQVYRGYLIEGLTENCMNIFQWLIREEPSVSSVSEKIDRLTARVEQLAARKPGPKCGRTPKKPTPGRKGSGLHGTKTEKMDQQMSAFKEYLREQGVRNAFKASYWAENWWRLNKADCTAAAKAKGEKRGYAEYSDLASAYRSWYSRQKQKVLFQKTKTGRETS